ncbi:hypothetical protein T492DRAFT_1093272 [Pavlovales sp. CCMP2436]|nr:hypothetical protein T492DRAFT_1093272 [Pavlovales sp. CCMP2436]
MQESAGGLTVETGAHESGDGGGAPTPQAGPRRLWATAFAAATAAAALTAADEESLLRGSPPSPDGRSEAHKNPGGGARKFAGAAQLTLALGLARMSSSGEPSGLGARGGTPSVGAGLEEFRGRMESLGLGRDAFDALSASGVRAPYSVAGSHTSAAQREVLRDGLAERRHSFCLLDKCFHELRFHAQSNVRVYEARMVSRFAGRRRAPLSAAERVRAAIARQATPGAASPSASPSSAGRSPRGLGQAGGESAARLLVGRPPAVSAAPHEGPGLLANGYLPSPASVWLPSPAHNSGHASRARSPQQNGFLHELLSSPPTARVGMMLHNKEVATEAGWGSSAPGGRQLSGSDSELSDSDEDLRGVGKTGGLGARDARTLPPLADAPPPIPARGYSLDPKLSAAVTAAPERGTTAGMRPLIAAMSSPSSARQRNFMPAGGRPLDPGVGFPPPPP